MTKLTRTRKHGQTRGAGIRPRRVAVVGAVLVGVGVTSLLGAGPASAAPAAPSAPPPIKIEFKNEHPTEQLMLCVDHVNPGNETCTPITEPGKENEVQYTPDSGQARAKVKRPDGSQFAEGPVATSEGQTPECTAGKDGAAVVDCPPDNDLISFG
jgi:hypothetical protein